MAVSRENKDGNTRRVAIPPSSRALDRFCKCLQSVGPGPNRTNDVGEELMSKDLRVDNWSTAAMDVHPAASGWGEDQAERELG